MTNEEWVKSLPPEKLVKLLRTFKEDACALCGYNNNECACGFCYDGQVAWMKAEHSSDDFDERSFRYIGG